MNHAWTLDIDTNWIAWLTLDVPDARVNMLTHDAMIQLQEHITDLCPNEAVKAVVLRSSKTDCFIVGADINELKTIHHPDDAKTKAEMGQSIFSAIARLPMPTVALVHGPCMGGGLELALACDYRIVSDHPKTSLGLPEVKLGIIPGWGGTQRLPRLVGLPQGMKMILTGKPVSASKAYRIGLADAVAAPPFMDQAARDLIEKIARPAGRQRARQRRMQRQPRLWRAAQRFAPLRSVMYRRARRDVLARTNGNYPAPLMALGVLRRTYGRSSLGAGLAVEASSFCRLACTQTCRNLIWLFQTSQRMKKPGGAAAPIRQAAVVGAGIMGSGIAWAFTNAGIPVRLRDVSWGAAAAGLRSISAMLQGAVRRRKMTAAERDLALHRVSPCIDYSGFGAADVVVEAIVEDLDIKTSALRDIETHAGPDTIICTNTSSLPLEKLAECLDHPERFIGLHFFNPVNRMQLVEVVPCAQTSPETVQTVADLARRMGKLPVVVGDCPGFLVNRILLPYLVESAWMLEEGVDMSRLDELLEQFGMPMGPITLVDEVGVDVGHKVARVLEDAYGDRMHVPRVLGLGVETLDLRGKKSGVGFYLWENGNKAPNPRIGELVREARMLDDIDPVESSDDDIIDRTVLIMVNEAARCLQERVVEDPQTLDFAMVMGTGFAPFRGGLLRYADQRGLDTVCARLDALAETHGERFRPAALLRSLAAEGRGFHETSTTPPADARPVREFPATTNGEAAPAVPTTALNPTTS